MEDKPPKSPEGGLLRKKWGQVEDVRLEVMNSKILNLKSQFSIPKSQIRR